MTPPPKPNLTPLDRTDEDLERLSEITPADIEAAVNWSAVKSNVKALLEAEAEDNE